MNDTPEQIWVNSYIGEGNTFNYATAKKYVCATVLEKIKVELNLHKAAADLYKQERDIALAQCHDLARMSDNWMRIAEMEEENNEQMRKALFELSDDCNWYTSYDSFSNEAVTSWRGNSEPDRIAYTALNPEKNKE